MMRQCVTAVVSRNEVWSGKAASEPYEGGWAGEAIVWLRCLGAVKGKPGAAKARVQISPDGMRWVDEGTKLKFPPRRAPSRMRASRISAISCASSPTCPRARRRKFFSP